MKIHTTTSKPLPEERETNINIIQNENGEWMAELDTNIRKYANKCQKQGWTKTSETLHTDGSWVSATFIATAKAISIGKAIRPTRVMSEEQKKALGERMRKLHSNK